MKKLSVSILLASLMLVGCSNDGVSGKYYYQSYSGGLNEDTYFDLKDDGTCTMVADGEKKACTYGDGVISIGDQSASYKIVKNVMTVSFPGTDGESMSFEKK